LAAEWKGPQVGVCLTVAEQGAHLVLTSLEALVEPGKGKRHALNYPVARLHALISILGRDLEQDFSKADVVLSHPGGWPLTDPTTDTAAALAIMSATYGRRSPRSPGSGTDLGRRGAPGRTAGGPLQGRGALRGARGRRGKRLRPQRAEPRASHRIRAGTGSIGQSTDRKADNGQPTTDRREAMKPNVEERAEGRT